MTRAYRAVVGAVLRHRTFVLEWFLALEALFCGLWILAPWPSFSANSLLSGLPEPLIGLVFILHGGLAAYALMKENAPRHPRSQANLDLCRRSALMSAWFWSLVLGSFALVSPQATLAIPVFMSFVFAAFWVYLRLYLRYGP